MKKTNLQAFVYLIKQTSSHANTLSQLARALANNDNSQEFTVMYALSDDELNKLKKQLDNVAGSVELLTLADDLKQLSERLDNLLKK